MNERYIKSLFDEEIREKKKTGRGVFSRKGKGVINKSNAALKTPYYFMSNKEKKKLNGDVEVFYMDTILTRDEFLMKDLATQKMLLGHWRDNYTNIEICKKMGGFNAESFNQLIKKLELPRKKAVGKKGVRVAKKIQEPKEPKEPKVLLAPVAKTGFNLTYHGKYGAEQLSKILTKLQLLIEGEETEFTLELTIVEE